MRNKIILLLRSTNNKTGRQFKNRIQKITTPYYFSTPGFTGWTERADML